MGTLAVTYNGTTKSYTMTGAPAVAYNGKTLLTASSWSGTKTLKCAGKYMKTNVTVGARTLKCAGTIAKTDIVLKYTASTDVKYQTITASGTFTIPSPYNRAQFFLVGGGGGGGDCGDITEFGDYAQNAFGGGGGGYTKTSSEIKTTPNTAYTIVVGAGGARNAKGGTSQVKSGSTVLASAAGGETGSTKVYIAAQKAAYKNVKGWLGGAGGSGGGGGRAMGGTTGDHYYSNNGYSSTISHDGNDGRTARAESYGDADDIVYTDSGAKGQGTTTKDPWYNIQYSGGGGGGTTTCTSSVCLVGGRDGGGGRGAMTNKNAGKGSAYYAEAGKGTVNTGGGGGGGATHRGGVDEYMHGAAGGSGVVIAKLWEV